MTAKSTATILLFLVGSLVCSRIHGRDAPSVVNDHEQCDPSDIRISTEATGQVVGGQPEYKVTIDNQCVCPQGDVVLSCPDGIPSSAEPVDSSKIHVQTAGLCLVNDGLPIAKGSPVTFTYAASATIDLTFYGATSQCLTSSTTH
ncbi:hypothetical protein GUJ93_ZPchr0011g28759 [Zizania palustris]|uniref:LGC1 n=1 Tax=Zizania palustris TaxID=103762 RepID=A0A8J5WIH5_ZIZPA|nr:hypothetical protein GUJ93_ZPchr0011g28884 [Zizania palustris]KAG8089460.1 hypothetical protein GUJ93_ZPchr0011g28759 [Zizania palustris]